MQNILVIGGNGFIGSAVCKAALSRGMRVTSLSSSGRPFQTPKGHLPAWTEHVEWCAGDALKPEEYRHLVDGKTAVVHTLGVLLESGSGSSRGGYKEAVRKGDPLGLLSAVVNNVSGSVLGGRRNPLEESAGEYERINRDSALSVCSTFASSSPPEPAEGAQFTRRRAIVCLSAEDIFRPLVPARYIETKRAAERGILRILNDKQDMRAVFIRPSLVYHSHFRPLTTPIATLMDLSAMLHRTLPDNIPTPASVLRALASSSSSSSSPSSSSHSSTSGYTSDHRAPGSLAPSPLSSIANALTVPPIHVDHVAEAIMCAIADDALEGVLDVRRMREVIGWAEKGSSRSADGGPRSGGSDAATHERI